MPLTAQQEQLYGMTGAEFDAAVARRLEFLRGGGVGKDPGSVLGRDIYNRIVGGEGTPGALQPGMEVRAPALGAFGESQAGGEAGVAQLGIPSSYGPYGSGPGGQGAGAGGGWAQNPPQVSPGWFGGVGDWFRRMFPGGPAGPRMVQDPGDRRANDIAKAVQRRLRQLEPVLTAPGSPIVSPSPGGRFGF